MEQIIRELEKQMLRVLKLSNCFKRANRPLSADIMDDIALKLQEQIHRLEDMP